MEDLRTVCESPRLICTRKVAFVEGYAGHSTKAEGFRDAIPITEMARSAVLRAPNKLNRRDEYVKRSGAKLDVELFVASECL